MSGKTTHIYFFSTFGSKIFVDKVFHFKKEYLHHFQGNNEVYHNLLSNNRIVKVTFMSAFITCLGP